MIKNILDLLSLNDYFGETEVIEIAKGKYEAPTNFKENKIHKQRNK